MTIWKKDNKLVWTKKKRKIMRVVTTGNGNCFVKCLCRCVCVCGWGGSSVCLIWKTRRMQRIGFFKYLRLNSGNEKQKWRRFLSVWLRCGNGSGDRNGKKGNFFSKNKLLQSQTNPFGGFGTLFSDFFFDEKCNCVQSVCLSVFGLYFFGMFALVSYTLNRIFFI